MANLTNKDRVGVNLSEGESEQKTGYIYATGVLKSYSIQPKGYLPEQY